MIFATRRPAILVLAVALLLPQLLGAAGVEDAAWPSALERPDDPPPVLVAIGPTFGGSPDWDGRRLGYSGSVIFHPAAAAQFYGELYDWNLALLLNWEWRRLAESRTLFTGGPALRWYLSDARGDLTGTRAFVGLGGGVASATYPAAAAATADDSTAASASVSWEETKERWVSALLEFGYEHTPAPGYVVVGKIQWRNYIKDERDYSNWTLHLQVGVPLP